MGMQMVMRLFFFGALCVCSVVGRGQKFPQDLWNKGYVVTVKKDTLYGAIRYNFDDNALQIKSGNKLLALGAKKILSFYTNDEYFGRKRRFFVLPVTSDNYPVPTLFEVLYEGPLTLLSREFLAVKTSTTPSAFSLGNSSYTVLSNYFYILNPEGNFFFVTSKKQFLLYSKKHKDDIRGYMRQKRLHYDKASDLISILHYYNTVIYKRKK